MAYQPRTSIDPTATSGTELANIVEEVGDLVQLVVISATSGEPGNPADGDAYIHNGDSSWSSGSPDDVMVWLDNVWHVFSPTEGWLAYVQDVNELQGYDGSTWDEAHVVRWLNTDSRYVKNDPEHATDSGTDTYVSATNTTPPADGVKITRDFQSASTTTTPTLDGKTMTTRDGSALWPGAVSGPHDVQYASGTDTYLVLDPAPSVQKDPVVPHTVQVFNASGTWNRPSGCRFVEMEIVGAGGGGGGVTGASSGSGLGGAGGGGGGYARKVLDVTGISSSTITIGSGGAGGAAGDNAGSAGGNSSWSDGNNTITGNGGKEGGSHSSIAPGAGGTASGGDFNITGSPGEIGMNGPQNLGGGGHGGSTIFGGGGDGQTTFNASLSGINGTSAGGGGSGASSENSGSNPGSAAGGDGANGIAVIREYY